MDINKTMKRRKNEWMIKADRDAQKILDEIRFIRLRKGLDRDKISYKDLLNGALRYPPLLDILKKAEIKRSRENE